MRSYGGRDQAMGFYYDKLLNAGAVDEEFQMYGCVYLTPEQPGFYVTEKEQKMFEFLLKCEQQEIYCTPVMQKTYWTKVAHGERQNLKRQYQIDMVNILDTVYHKSFFSAIKKLNGIAGADASKMILLEWREKLDGSYDVDLLQLYEATTAMAVQMKLLSRYTAENLVAWKKQVEKQLLNDERPQDGDMHMYAGLAYKKMNEETIHYVQYGKYYTAWEKRQKLILEGWIVSPVFTKQMYFSATDFRIIQLKKQEFENCMREKMGITYFSMLQRIYNLSNVISDEEYRMLLSNVTEHCGKEEKTAFQLYGAQLRML